VNQNEPLSHEAVAEGHKSGFVAVIGRPNVGKSTLMNTLLRQKIAIVTPRPQTTRIRQLGIITQPEYQVVFVDTPGMIQPRHKLDEYMMQVAVSALDDAEIVLWMVDASDDPGPGDREIARQLGTLGEKVTLILGMNKSDLLAAHDVLPRTEAYRALLPDAQWLLFSASQNAGCDELLQMIIDALPEGPRYYPPDQITDLYLRDMAAELIREQAMRQLREEIPHGVAVQVDEYKERPNGTTYIHATIFVERKNHKAIVIGAKGAQLRRLGVAARQEIEKLIEGKLFLELWVKVEPNWRSNSRSLKRLGYSHE
jgi:GTP-binding protein Era